MKLVCKLFALVLLAGAALVGCGEAEKPGITIGRGAIHMAQPAPELLPWLQANFRPDAKELIVLFWHLEGEAPAYNIIKNGQDMIPPIDRTNAGIGSRGPHAQLAPHSHGFKFVWREGRWVEAFTADTDSTSAAVLYSPMFTHLEKLGYGKKYDPHQNKEPG